MSKRANLCVHVFPSMDYVEIVQLDTKNQGNVDKAATLPAAFDQNTRQIIDVEAMGQVIKDLYDANRLPTSTPAVLVIPSFFTREIELPSELPEEDLRATLIAEAERFYIFKKNEPQVDWIKINETKLVYTAYPKAEIEKYVQIFQTYKIPLLAIELNYFSILRGLVASGAITDEITNRQKWCLLVIADYTFFTALCEGGKIEKTLEAPLSIGMNDELSTIAEIKQDFDRFLGVEAVTKLIVVNNSDRIATEVLVNRLDLNEQILIIEQTAATLRSRGDLNAIYPCSLEGIGGALYTKFPELPYVNLMPELTNDLIAIMEAQQWIIKGLVVVNVLAVLLCLAAWGLFSFFVLAKDGEVKALAENASQLATGQSSKEVQRKRFIKNAIDQNMKSNLLIIKAGSLIPNDLWLDNILMSYDVKTKGFGVEIQGGALTPELVQQFQNELKKESQVDDLEVGKVDLANSAAGQSFYAWEIQTRNTKPDKEKDEKH